MKQKIKEITMTINELSSGFHIVKMTDSQFYYWPLAYRHLNIRCQWPILESDNNATVAERHPNVKDCVKKSLI